MPLLDALLEKKIRMVDYERIREAGGANPQRLVAFGRYAGIAGAIDFIRGIGEFLLQRKISTPFVNMGSTYMYSCYEDMQDGLAKVSKLITQKSISKTLLPCVFGVTGTGRVADGAMEVLKQLPHEIVSA